MTYRTTVTIQSPVAVSQRRATGNDIATKMVISGGTLRGAAAAEYLRESKGVDDGFRELFLAGEVQFRDARPEGSRPWPLSVRCCKERAGDHCLTDLLLPVAAGLRTAAKCESMLGARECGAKLEEPKSFCGWSGDRRRPYKSVVPRIRRVAHAAVDPVTLRAANGQFHTAQVLCAGQTLLGSIAVERPETGERLEKFFGAGRTLTVGRGRTRGQGRIAVTIDQMSPADDPVDRVRRFSEDVSARFRTFRDQVVFTCTLRSPAIFLDRWMRSCTVPPAEELSPGLKVYGAAIGAFAKLVDVRGWHASARLPKAETGAAGAGSCYVFARPVAPSARETEYRRLGEEFARLEEAGVGERCEEGFGEVSFCDAFHLELCAMEDWDDA